MPKHASEQKKLDWKRRIEEQLQSSLSVNKWCQQNQICCSTFQYWQRKLSVSALQRDSFAELNVKHHKAFSLQTCGLSIRMNRDCNPNLRRQILALFAEASC